MVRSSAGIAALLLAPTLALANQGGSLDKPRSVLPEAPAAAAPEATSTAVEAAAVEPADAGSRALRDLVTALPEGETDEAKNERVAIAGHYAATGYAALWVGDAGWTAKGEALVAEIGRGADWGLDPDAIGRRTLDGLARDAARDPAAQAELELATTRAALTYAFHARGGRIIAPSELLNSHLDRRPQLIEPKLVIERLAAAADVAATLTGFHPQHPQFQRLAAKYAAERAKGRGDAALAKSLRANMEMWRWMHDNLGESYVFANVPEFMMRYVRDGEVVHTERVVVGEVGKQSSIFTRNLKSITLRPMWRVPESIKVRELWPSLKRGGGLMRQHGLEVETKDGRPLDWRTMNWAHEDIRNYEVVQPPGPKSAMGVVKFSFPSQHTIFMHDTVDKWMFGAKQRTLSHGCLRLRNPVRLAEIVLAEDKGWDEEKIADLIRRGPLNNEIAMEKRIRVHLAYFTAWVDDEGGLRRFGDVYGHERRVSLALDGRWDAIDKGVDHLAPVKPLPQVAGGPQRTAGVAKPKPTAFDDFLGSMLGGMP